MKEIYACEVQFRDKFKNQFLLLIIPFTGTHEPNKLTCPQLSGFIAQFKMN